jgi:hypothetical protein
MNVLYFKVQTLTIVIIICQKNNSTSIIVESKKKQIIVTYKYIGLLLSKSISK